METCHMEAIFFPDGCFRVVNPSNIDKDGCILLQFLTYWLCRTKFLGFNILKVQYLCCGARRMFSILCSSRSPHDTVSSAMRYFYTILLMPNAPLSHVARWSLCALRLYHDFIFQCGQILIKMPRVESLSNFWALNFHLDVVNPGCFGFRRILFYGCYFMWILF